LLNNLQSQICKLAHVGDKISSMKLIEKYSLSAIIRFMAINTIKFNMGYEMSQNCNIILTNSEKLLLYKKIGQFMFKKKNKFIFKKIIF
jgi:hypothetical protein